MSESRFIEPLDVLFLRGNHSFGDPGDVGHSIMPPSPAVLSGTIRSWLLVDAGIDPVAFARDEVAHPWLGTPRNPGDFSLRRVAIGRRLDAQRAEPLFPLPADLIVLADGIDGQTVPRIHRLRPQAFGTPGQGSCAALLGSTPLPTVAMLQASRRAKPLGGFMIDATGYRDALHGEVPEPARLLRTDQLWSTELRVGIGLSAQHGRVEEGRLFTAEAIAPVRGVSGSTVGFCVAVDGCNGTLPDAGMLRLGGDGRGAVLGPAIIDWPAVDLATVVAARRCRVVLDSPGLFPDGWRLPGMERDGRWRLGDVSARVTCAAVPRCRVISGFDVARGRPKRAERAAPTGSVYWLEDLDADTDTLAALLAHGLWPDNGTDKHRRAEGFNRFSFGLY